MVAAIERGTTYQRRYQPTPNSYVTVWCWQERDGMWCWKCSWHGVNIYGMSRFQFRSYGEAGTLRGAWGEVRNHFRIYAGGRDLLKQRKAGGRCH